MAMKSNFDSSSDYYRDYVNYEVEALSKNLINQVADAKVRASTEAHGAAVQNCALIASYYERGAIEPVQHALEVLNDAGLIYYRVIWEELANMNAFKEGFDIFYYKFNLRLQESYDHLNDVLLENVLQGLYDLMDSARLVTNTLENCLNAIA